ncbi:Uncharacterized conserved protein [Loktanella sp. DSM 29012]|uniref:extensin-like domain-containing protein n=1 Tax=Loktanella sp. DSM 29012 TaxID=1881056 RepID=UPI0008C14CA7|nr:extensin family protein [Loktanella sp. DSM 29012]SEP81506.1 Uncharacterized conserved protein [Loktanella sp. DSM 29012]
MRPILAVPSSRADLAGLLALCLALAGSAAAQGASDPSRPVARSLAEEPLPRPVPRPQITGLAEDVARSAPLVRPVLRPRVEPSLAIGYETTPLRRAERELFAFSPFAPRAVDRPAARPASIVSAAAERRQERLRGQICGDPAIQGEAIGNIGGPGACGVTDAVRVRSVSGVTLQPAPTVDCTTATAMKDWVAQGIKPAVGTTGGGVTRLRVIGHYSCRNRVGGSSGSSRLSEHSYGRAVDVAGIGLASGREITLLTDWNKPAEGAILREVWRSACGPFGTVLGPDANAAHRDHFHVDTARYRSGSYCR